MTASEGMGLTVPDPVQFLFPQITKERQLPFVPLTPNAYTLAAIKEAVNVELMSFDTVDGLFEDSNA